MSFLLSTVSYVLEQIGLYEPTLDLTEATKRLQVEKKLWESVQGDRSKLWNDFQSNNPVEGYLSPLAERAVAISVRTTAQGVAVELGCGINSTTVNLLRRGWKVYAVDNSSKVLDKLKEKIGAVENKWVEEGKLVLVNQSVEQFVYPENVNLILAQDALPYCDPEEISTIFLKAKNALLPQGVFACSFFPYTNSMADQLLRGLFGAWLTTRNVIEAVAKSIEFPELHVYEGTTPLGLSKQIHLIARNT